jgi:hypothetical protein
LGQKLHDEAPTVEENWPAGQGLHIDEPEVEYSPILHCEHTEDLTKEYVPAGQTLQYDQPPNEYVPAWHVIHPDAP